MLVTIIGKGIKLFLMDCKLIKICCSVLTECHIKVAGCSIRVFNKSIYFVFQISIILITIMITKVGGKSSMWAGDRKLGFYSITALQCPALKVCSNMCCGLRIT